MRRSPISRSFPVLLAVGALFLGACSSDSSSSTEAVAETSADAPAADAPASDAASAPVSTELSVESTAAQAATPGAAPAATPGAPACPATDGSAPTKREFTAEPPLCIEPTKSYTATMETSEGTMTFKLSPDKAPRTVNSFVFLARQHYFDGIAFHRVVPNFVLQAGDPYTLPGNEKGPIGTGGPGYQFDDELPAPGTYTVGSLVMANAGPNTNGSQFFIVSGQAGTQLPPNYAMFGQLESGQETVDKIAALGVNDGPPSKPVTITKVTITEA